VSIGTLTGTRCNPSAAAHAADKRGGRPADHGRRIVGGSRLTVKHGGVCLTPLQQPSQDQVRVTIRIAGAHDFLIFAKALNDALAGR
jgi:hypothetical protein